MGPLLALSRIIDRINTVIGRAAAWLILVAVVVSAVNAVVRKAFDVSSNAWLELQWYLFGAVVLLCAGYTLLRNEHIRIDIAVAWLPKRARDWIEIFGIVFFLMPFALIHIWHGVPFFLHSFREQEYSSDAGGLIVWPAKLLIPVGFSLLALQGLSELIKRIAIVMGVLPDAAAPAEHAGPH
ncbi:MAG TPA: TRAP transporter small permease subunit [Hyphomicrobiales bacterium]|nr:TRAP transporter small permease subunit [Hyphomicrobiales bacterium]